MTHKKESTKETVLRLLKNQELCTLATASENAVPEAATVRFVCDDDMNVYINSGSTYRKYENMKENPDVAVVVNGDRKNVQIEGMAEEVFNDEADFVRNKYKNKYGSSQYLTNDESVFFRIDTSWARLLVDGRYPPEYEMIIGDGDTDPHNEIAEE